MNHATNNSLVVGGIGADGHGVVTGFRSDGPMERRKLCALAARAGIEEEWYPAPKEPAAQLSRAVRSVAGARA